MPRNNFHKSERLCSLHLIDRLFEPGNSSSIAAYPLRMVYRIEDAVPQYSPKGGAERGLQLLISVPKRQFKHAVDRNHVKRQVREAYRTNKDLILLPDNKALYMAFIWLDNRHHPSREVTAKVCNLLTRMSERINVAGASKLT